MADAERIDWAHLMRLGMGALRLPPDAFWAMTPVELLAALQGAGIAPIGGFMDRNALDSLMAAFPDTGASLTPTHSEQDKT